MQSSNSNSSPALTDQAELFGHPTGLFTLFFAEMWERFSYYGMRALLVFYMIKGFLGYNDGEAYGIYGAYTALVYATPFIGGMIADRLLGARRAVILGGLLMAAGHLVMTIEQKDAFFTALALLIVGNGFFKPNISTIVGSLYRDGDIRRDGGFTIFYMGINLGAALAPLLCGYVGETWGWHYGFGLATAGMIMGLAVFVFPAQIARLLVLIGSLATAIVMIYIQRDNHVVLLALYALVAVALIASGWIAFLAIGRGGIPHEAGRPRDPEAPGRILFAGLRTDICVYIGTGITVVLLMLLVQKNELAGWILSIFGLAAFAYLTWYAIKSPKIIRERLYVVLILMFFSMLFWAFFEQAGSSVNNFTDRNVDRVIEERTVAADEVGKTISFRVDPAVAEGATKELPILSSEQFGLTNGDLIGYQTAAEAMVKVKTDALDAQIKGGEVANDDVAKKKTEIADLELAMKDAKFFSLSHLTYLRDFVKDKRAEDRHKKIDWVVTEDNVGMGVGGTEIPASTFQAVNPIYILIFGLVFTWLWAFLGARGLEPSTPFKFSLGLLQLGMGFGCFWIGAQTADARGMSGMSWLLLGYLLQTTGELCLSPVGLSMVTKLSPKAIVSTVMGAWFLATAFSNYLAGMIAKLTGVEHGSDGAEGLMPKPIDTVHVYGDVFLKIAIAAIGSAVICFALSPLLKKWMHEGEHVPEED